MSWKPITLEALTKEIKSGEAEMSDQRDRLWQLVRIRPEKWEETTYGTLGGGFWVVGLVGNYVLWYNDIEEGFNISRWSKFGTIDEYVCNDDPLNMCIYQLFELIDNGRPPLRLGPPEPISFDA